jgi:NADH:ubiquinone oxidoreductase subunit F (NADH-binding)
MQLLATVLCMSQGTAVAVSAMAACSHNKGLKRECLECLCKLAALEGAEAELAQAGSIACAMQVQVLELFYNIQYYTCSISCSRCCSCSSGGSAACYEL